MKINRYRKVNRTLKFYANHFGFRKPYQVLLDGTICVAALKNKVNVREQFMKYLDGDVKLLTTQCIVKEVESLGSAVSKALYVLKNFGQHSCGHDQNAIPASDCILEMVQKGSNSRYIIASQDRELQSKCRRLVGIPILYFHMRVPTLEAPSEATQNAVLKKSLPVQRTDDQKEKPSQDEENEKPAKRKRKVKGGPNPLSCKKKKRGNHDQNLQNPNNNKSKKKKKRKHCSSLVKKIKSEVLASINSKGNDKQ